MLVCSTNARPNNSDAPHIFWCILHSVARMGGFTIIQSIENILFLILAIYFIVPNNVWSLLATYMNQQIISFMICFRISYQKLFEVSVTIFRNIPQLSIKRILTNFQGDQAYIHTTLAV